MALGRNSIKADNKGRSPPKPKAQSRRRRNRFPIQIHRHRHRSAGFFFFFFGMDTVPEARAHHPASEEAEAASPASHRRKCKKLMVKKKHQKPRLLLHRPRPLDLEALAAEVEKLVLEKHKEKLKEEVDKLFLEKHKEEVEKLVSEKLKEGEKLKEEVEKLVLEKEKLKEEEKKKQQYKDTHWWLLHDVDRPSRAEVKKRWPLPEEEYPKENQWINVRAGWTTGPGYQWGSLPVDEFRKRMKEIGYNPNHYYHPPPNCY